MTLAEIKTATAAILNVTEADLTVGSTDMSLVAFNQVRRDAEQNWDFGFQRKLVQVSVDPVTGGSLTGAVLRSDGTTAVKIKTVVDIGEFDTDGNLRPAEWTSVAEGLERQRQDNSFTIIPRYPTDGEVLCGPWGVQRYELVGDSIWRFPKVTSTTVDTVVGMEVYSYQDDWATVGTDLAAVVGGDFAGVFSAQGKLNDAVLYLNFNTIGSDSTILARNAAKTKWAMSFFQDWSPTGGIGDGYTFTSTSASPVGTYTLVGGASPASPTVTVSSVSDEWTEHAHQYLLWGAVVHLNHIFKTFVPRTEGNLPPPTAMMQQGLESFKLWDREKFEKYRRHSR